jgi:hypothetical protein
MADRISQTLARRAIRPGADNHQYKTNAGASNLVSRIATVADLKGPKHLSTNVTIPSLTAGKSSLYFLPDRVLVRDGKPSGRDEGRPDMEVREC